MRVQLSAQVKLFLSKLAPEPRKMILMELTRLESGQARLHALVDDLDGFYKVRAARYRVVCAVESNTIYALVAEHRSVIYEVVTAELLESILQRGKK